MSGGWQALIKIGTERRVDTSMKPRAHWRDHGVKVIPGSQLDLNTPQTPSMTRAAAITYARTGASKLWAGTFTVEPNAKTGAHHHGELESVIGALADSYGS